jgi:hypothetical protein
MGAERAAQIAEMESMGFERSQIDLAMRAAFFNSERAIEYLLTVSEFCHDINLDTNELSREFLRTSSKNREHPLLRRTLRRMRHQTQLLQRLLVVRKELRSQSIFLRLQHNVEDLVVHLVQAVTFSGQQLELHLEPERLQAVWETSISYEIMPNFNSYDRLFSKTHRCSSQFFNRSVQEIHNWRP